jgi:hypothetical protein
VLSVESFSPVAFLRIKIQDTKLKFKFFFQETGEYKNILAEIRK